ncbi:MAG: hypothetical protein ACQESK_06215 [Bacteroidota bacterium]
MKKGFLLFSLMGLALLGVVSCSSDDDNGDNNGGDVTSIMLDASSTSVEPGDSVDFTVMTNTDEDVTDMSILEVDGDPIDGSSYTFDAEGTYSVMAVYESLESNEVEVTVGAAGGDADYVMNTENFLLVFWGGVQPGGEGTETFGYFSLINFEGEDLEASPEYSEVDVLMPLTDNDELQFPGENGINPNFFELYTLRSGGVDVEITEDSSEGTVVISDMVIPQTEEETSNINYQADVTFNGDTTLDASYEGEWFFSDQSEQGGGGEGRSPQSVQVRSMQELIAKKEAFLNK